MEPEKTKEGHFEYTPKGDQRLSLKMVSLHSIHLSSNPNIQKAYNKEIKIPPNGSHLTFISVALIITDPAEFSLSD